MENIDAVLLSLFLNTMQNEFHRHVSVHLLSVGTFLNVTEIFRRQY